MSYSAESHRLSSLFIFYHNHCLFVIVFISLHELALNRGKVSQFFCIYVENELFSPPKGSSYNKNVVTAQTCVLR